MFFLNRSVFEYIYSLYQSVMYSWKPLLQTGAERFVDRCIFADDMCLTACRVAVLWTSLQPLRRHGCWRTGMRPLLWDVGCVGHLLVRGHLLRGIPPLPRRPPTLRTLRATHASCAPPPHLAYNCHNTSPLVDARSVCSAHPQLASGCAEETLPGTYACGSMPSTAITCRDPSQLEAQIAEEHRGPGSLTRPCHWDS